MQDEIGDLVVFIFFVKKLGAKFFHTLCCLSQIKKFQIIHSHSMDYTGLIIWLAFRHLTHPILQGSFFVQNLFSIIHGWLSLLFRVSATIHFQTRKDFFSKTWYGFLVLTLFSVSWSVTLSCQHCLFNTPPLCCHSIWIWTWLLGLLRSLCGATNVLSNVEAFAWRLICEFNTCLFVLAALRFRFFWQRSRLISEWRASGLELGSK